ncbi:MAG: RsmD family RNA methyltransferase [Actinomycetota bacterium]
MRVIAGSAKGTRLGPVPAGVRPVSDRAREGLFSSLSADVPGASVLDLFAGTGALGIEALSRGAERAVFVERSRAAVRAVRDNLERTGLTDRAEVIAAEAVGFVTRDDDRTGAFDLVLADPPYDHPPEEVDALLQGLARGRLEGPWAVALTRRSRSSTPVIPVHWLVAKRLEYGDTAVLVFREVGWP